MIRGGTVTSRGELLRIRILLLVMLAMLGLLAAALWRVQVAQGHEFEGDLKKQSVRRVRLPGQRGEILDRHGHVLAGNRPSYCIALYLEELRQGGRSNTVNSVMERLDGLGLLIGRDPELDREDVNDHILQTLPLPLIAWRDLDEAELARFAEHAASLSGVDVFVEAVRVYPEGRTACHVLGSVKFDSKIVNADQPFHYFYPETVGRAGLEKRFDEDLAGVAGGKSLLVDVSGYRHEDLAVREPEAGSDLLLALDLKAQRAAEQALQGVAGAAVIMDPRNGDVLALASAPTYDPNEFVPILTQATWDRLNSDPGHPMVHRAVAGTYAPGSVFKPVTAFAALENGKINAGTSFTCPGYFELGRARFNCWYRHGHGAQNVRGALRNSCNVFFYETGLLTGREMIAHMASAMGFGEKTGIDIDYEAPGRIPLRHQQQGWYSGDTCNFSIGQGPVTVTPLQMAVMASTIANGGNVPWPRLVLGIRAPGQDAFAPIPPRMVNRMNWSKRSLDLVQGGMRDVVMHRSGTGRLARIPGINVSGKTGTAEFGKKGNPKKRAWMIVYAPTEKPRYAIALVVDEGQGGGVDAAPRVQYILGQLFDVPLPESEVVHG